MLFPDHRMISFFAVFVCLAIAACGSHARAETFMQEDGINYEIEQHTQKDEYLPTSFENLSQLYWAVGMHDLQDDLAIDNYLMINECEMYLRYYHSDFEWERIQDAARESITANMANFPRKFEAILPIQFDRYDMEREVFELKEDSVINSMVRVELLTNSIGSVCDKRGEIQGYPRNIILVLNRPFSLSEVPVRRDIAELYLREARQRFDRLPLNIQQRAYERTAFLRLKVTMQRFHDVVSSRSGYLRAVIYGQVDGWEVYADEHKERPLYMRDASEGSARQRYTQQLLERIEQARQRGQQRHPELYQP